jgi:TDG/mug DNA glycosylase family protein
LLLEEGLGITNLVARATGSAAELTLAELRAGRRRLEAKTRRYSPGWVAIVGIGAYRMAFERPQAQIGLNANHQLGDLTRAFRALRIAARGGRDG